MPDLFIVEVGRFWSMSRNQDSGYWTVACSLVIDGKTQGAPFCVFNFTDKAQAEFFFDGVSA